MKKQNDTEKTAITSNGVLPEVKKGKGEFLGICNLSRCKSGKLADWYNYGTRNYYCISCAKELNADEYNKRDALRLFGHELCIQGEAETH